MLDTLEEDIRILQQQIRDTSGILSNVFDILNISELPQGSVLGTKREGERQVSRLLSMHTQMEETRYMLDHLMSMTRVIRDALVIDPNKLDAPMPMPKQEYTLRDEVSRRDKF